VRTKNTQAYLQVKLLDIKYRAKVESLKVVDTYIGHSEAARMAAGKSVERMQLGERDTTLAKFRF
jgi:hypothetical protein